jgi:hypothetical protein
MQAVYLLYWYKSTNTNAGVTVRGSRDANSVYLLYWYKSTNTDAGATVRGSRDANSA